MPNENFLSPAQSLSNLFNLLRLPTTLHYLPDLSVSTSEPSLTALRTIGGPVQFIDAPTLLPSLHALLNDFARAYPLPDDALHRIESILRSDSEKVLTYGPMTRLSGEAGLQVFLDAYLVANVNVILAETAFRAGEYKLYWRTVGKGRSGRADLELVLVWIKEGLVEEKILAIVEIKTTGSLSVDHTRLIKRAAQSGSLRIRVDGSVMAGGVNGFTESPRRVIQQVRVHNITPL